MLNKIKKIVFLSGLMCQVVLYGAHAPAGVQGGARSFAQRATALVAEDRRLDEEIARLRAQRPAAAVAQPAAPVAAAPVVAAPAPVASVARPAAHQPTVARRARSAIVSAVTHHQPTPGLIVALLAGAAAVCIANLPSHVQPTIGLVPSLGSADVAMMKVPDLSSDGVRSWSQAYRPYDALSNGSVYLAATELPVISADAGAGEEVLDYSFLLRPASRLPVVETPVRAGEDRSKALVVHSAPDAERSHDTTTGAQCPRTVRDVMSRELVSYAPPMCAASYAAGAGEEVLDYSFLLRPTPRLPDVAMPVRVREDRSKALVVHSTPVKRPHNNTTYARRTGKHSFRR